MYPQLKGRVLAFCFGFKPISEKLFTTRKPKRAIPNDHECKEVWRKRKIGKESYLKNSDVTKYTEPLKNIDKLPVIKKYKTKKRLQQI